MHATHRGGYPTSLSGYGSLSFIDIARQRGGWLFLFLGGLLLCASVMHSFEALLEAELELAFFVPLLIGHGGNSGGQTTSTVIRALGSGSVKLSDASRVIAKEGAAGVLQSIFLALALFPCLRYGMGISERVCVVVGLTMPCLGGFANTLGATLPFLATWIGMDPAIICGPLTTTSVDTCGLMTYLTIATTYLKIALGGKA